jgi:hypothetical protein
LPLSPSLAALCLAALFSSSCRGAAAPPFKPIADVKQLMASVLDPQADIVWESVATITTAAGTEERKPNTPEQWAAVRNAMTLAESGNLLMMVPRAKDGGDWMKYSRELIDVSEQAVRAADARDAARIYEIGGDINDKCMQCHEQYDPTILRDLGKIK